MPVVVRTDATHFGFRRLGIITVVAAAFALVLSLLTPAVALPGSLAGPGAAEAAPINLTIKNVGAQGMFVCRNWTDAVTTRPNCPSTVGYLSPGASTSNLGWADTDGVQIGTRKKLMERSIVGSGKFTQTVVGTIRSCNYGNAYYLKVQPMLTRPTRNFYIENC